MYAPNYIHQTMQAVHNPREKYSNLIFILFNALFLLAIFWMLPALGGEPGRPAAASRQSVLHASRQQTEKRLMVQNDVRALFMRTVMVNFSKLPR
jgi:hypothetical protein